MDPDLCELCWGCVAVYVRIPRSNCTVIVSGLGTCLFSHSRPSQYSLQTVIHRWCSNERHLCMTLSVAVETPMSHEQKRTGGPVHKALPLALPENCKYDEQTGKVSKTSGPRTK